MLEVPGLEEELDALRNDIYNVTRTPRSPLVDDEIATAHTPGSAISWALSDSSTERNTPQNGVYMSASASNTPRRRLAPRPRLMAEG